MLGNWRNNDFSKSNWLETLPNSLSLCSYQTIYKMWPATGKLSVKLAWNFQLGSRFCGLLGLGLG